MSLMLALDPVARLSTAASACPLSSALGSHARSRKATSKLDGRRVCGAAGCLRSASRVNEWLACSRNIARYAQPIHRRAFPRFSR